MGPPEETGLVGIEAEYLQTHCVAADGAQHFGVSALTFDKHEELLWMGNQGVIPVLITQPCYLNIKYATK